MTDREKMDAAIRAALKMAHGERPLQLDTWPATPDERAIYRAGYLAGMRAAAEIADKWRRTEEMERCCDQAQHAALTGAAFSIRAAADKLEQSA